MLAVGTLFPCLLLFLTVEQSKKFFFFKTQTVCCVHLKQTDEIVYPMWNGRGQLVRPATTLCMCQAMPCITDKNVWGNSMFSGITIYMRSRMPFFAGAYYVLACCRVDISSIPTTVAQTSQTHIRQTLWLLKKSMKTFAMTLFSRAWSVVNTELV